MENLAEAIQKALVNGQLPCAVAFLLAEEAGVEPRRVGEEADRLGLRLSKCQLGLFGYGSKAEGKHRRVRPMQDVPAEMAEAIRAALDEDGKLSCAAAWRVSAQLGVPKRRVSDAVEGLGLRIKDCQLGAF